MSKQERVAQEMSSGTYMVMKLDLRGICQEIDAVVEIQIPAGPPPYYEIEQVVNRVATSKEAAQRLHAEIEGMLERWTFREYIESRII